MFPLAVAGFAAGMLIRKLGSLALGRASEGGTVILPPENVPLS
jgi:hypothetical protein